MSNQKFPLLNTCIGGPLQGRTIQGENFTNVTPGFVSDIKEEVLHDELSEDKESRQIEEECVSNLVYNNKAKSDKNEESNKIPDALSDFKDEVLEEDVHNSAETVYVKEECLSNGIIKTELNEEDYSNDFNILIKAENGMQNNEGDSQRWCGASAAGTPSLKPWEVIIVTMISGLYFRNGNDTFYVAVDLFSGFFEVAPTRGVHEKPLTHFIKIEVAARWTSPKSVMLDPQLEHLLGKLEMTGLEVKLCTDNVLSSDTLQPFHAFKRRIKSVNGEWLKMLPGMLWEARNTVVPGTGTTPKQLLTLTKGTPGRVAKRPRKD